MSLTALQGDFRCWLIDASPEAADRIGQAARPGLSVYQNNYRAQLMACLCETYEQTHAWLGDEAFLAAAASHVDATPPSAWTLDAYPIDFAETLGAIYPGDPEVAELAALEWALSRTFTAADAIAMTPDMLASVNWDSAALHFASSLTILVATSNAAAIWSALSKGEMPPDAVALPEPAALLVWRQDFTPCFRTIDAVEERAITLCMGGAAFGALCGSMIEALGETEGIARAAALLGQWIADGLIVGTSE
ncbi:Putative DNA-binding domain-containing protein [Sphingobium sp. AP50]|uniref:HvfC/BufC N-terminal domain-containing protein n=1 Tax=Sphingobium sp. AP50 TaxID=1884369 RepID=UPI0008CD7190|nr:DNA-binding domain-containing protein [Sphingobium sp. AP50]SEI83980.1 Putative DNA-binding domain-containing protein [Sphingobium sp. AP50]